MTRGFLLLSLTFKHDYFISYGTKESHGHCYSAARLPPLHTLEYVLLPRAPEVSFLVNHSKTSQRLEAQKQIPSLHIRLYMHSFISRTGISDVSAEAGRGTTGEPQPGVLPCLGKCPSTSQSSPLLPEPRSVRQP